MSLIPSFRRPDLFVGVTTWNSGLLLPHCLQSIRRTTSGLRVRLGVVDNCSTDNSVDVARQFGASVEIIHCSQALALNRLLARSRARMTLLVHSDVVLLSPAWFAVCQAKIRGSTVLVSPEDVGCGPLTRPYGRGKPESSFLLFDTNAARRIRKTVWVQRGWLRIPRRVIEFDSLHVTHSLPSLLASHGMDWCPMHVHPSPSETHPVYRPSFTPEYWSRELEHLRYGMGNFYSLNGVITHYHNWYDRVPKSVPSTSTETTGGGGLGLPIAYISLCTNRFLQDLGAGQIRVPSASQPMREARETPRHSPSLSRPFTDEA
jgi:glycosyltransferase involved in cell wall biosynthesis